jgi:WD40 repeat protein
MVYLDDLTKDPIKFSNVYPNMNDNSTWSLDGFTGSSTKAPKVVVGSNAWALSIFDLKEGKKIEIPGAHDHNIPSVSFSPCGNFIATTSIDKSMKIWENTQDNTWRVIRMGQPDNDWGWGIKWVNRNHCIPKIVQAE